MALNYITVVLDLADGSGTALACPAEVGKSLMRSSRTLYPPSS